MKTLTIAGNVGKDAVLRRTQGGDPVLGWTVAVEERGRDGKRTLWFDCSLWGKRGEALEPHIKKGGRITVSGELSTREHEGKTYLTLKAAEVTLQGGGQADPLEESKYGTSNGRRQQPRRLEEDTTTGTDFEDKNDLEADRSFLDSDIPF